MKRILITGVNSYVGNSLAKWLGKNPHEYLIDMISLKDDNWREKNFFVYDVIVHVAGIAHQKETKENAHLYYEVNRDLAYEVAKKAKAESVGQLIFLSSMSVYGLDSGVIDENTPLNPKSNYGKSKLEAEEMINTLVDNRFRVAIVRPPMIYGKGCKGNYTRLAKLALKTPVFPDIENKRSMIFIDNLSAFLRCVIDNCSRGLLYPQNSEYVKTSIMVELIANTHGRKIWVTKLFNPLLNILKNRGTVKKVFGNLVYEKSLSENNNFQCITLIGLEESIRLTED